MSTHDGIERVAQAGDVERVRATPLKPAVWMTSVLVWATVVALIGRVPTWASVFLCVVTGISFLWFLVTYIYLFVTDPDTLRAERYRGRKRRRSEREVGGGQTLELSQSTGGYLEPEHSGSGVVRENEVDRNVSIGGASRAVDSPRT
jgi:hypothetical protein